MIWSVSLHTVKSQWSGPRSSTLAVIFWRLTVGPHRVRPMSLVLLASQQTRLTLGTAPRVDAVASARVPVSADLPGLDPVHDIAIGRASVVLKPNAPFVGDPAKGTPPIPHRRERVTPRHEWANDRDERN